jgi:hypothetical protein
LRSCQSWPAAFLSFIMLFPFFAYLYLASRNRLLPIGSNFGKKWHYAISFS